MTPEAIFPLRPGLRLPSGVQESELLNWLLKVKVDGADPGLENYCREDFRRFVYTLDLVWDATHHSGISRPKCLELGGNPYFTTMLLRQFASVELTIANYFGEGIKSGLQSQTLSFTPFRKEGGVSDPTSLKLDYWHFNTEEDDFPFDDQSFDVVLFCEIIEHLLMDPVRVLLQIKRVLKPGGQLILSTPNVSRLENVARMLSGSNIYDPYSGYGPYGRHNREYNKHELDLLLRHAGYRVEHMFSADVHENRVNSVFDIDRFLHLVKFREHDLGQYIFVRAVSRGGGSGKKPNWLYRSYPSSELGE